MKLSILVLLSLTLSAQATQTPAPDPKDATIAYQQSLISWHEQKEKLLLDMLLQKIRSETQAMQDRLNELDKQKPAPTEAKKPIGQ